MGGVLNKQLQNKIQIENNKNNNNNGNYSTANETSMTTNNDKNLIVMSQYIDQLKQTDYMKYNDDEQFKILMKAMIDLQHALMVYIYLFKKRKYLFYFQKFLFYILVFLLF